MAADYVIRVDDDYRCTLEKYDGGWRFYVGNSAYIQYTDEDLPASIRGKVTLILGMNEKRSFNLNRAVAPFEDFKDIGWEITKMTLAHGTAPKREFCIVLPWAEYREVVKADWIKFPIKHTSSHDIGVENLTEAALPYHRAQQHAYQNQNAQMQMQSNAYNQAGQASTVSIGVYDAGGGGAGGSTAILPLTVGPSTVLTGTQQTSHPEGTLAKWTQAVMKKFP